MGSYGGFSLHVGQILLVILIILILLVLASCVKIVPQAQALYRGAAWRISGNLGCRHAF